VSEPHPEDALAEEQLADLMRTDHMFSGAVSDHGCCFSDCPDCALAGARTGDLFRSYINGSRGT
jgi:hypothetical protein